LSEKQRWRLTRKWAFRWVGPVLFIVLWQFTDLGQVRDLVGRMKSLPLVGAVLLNALLVVIKAWRWREIMKVQGIDYGYARSVRAYSIACAVAAWTPGRLGDFTKAVNVSRERKVSFGRAASSVIADRLLDAFALTLVAAAGALLLGTVAGTVTWCLVALACVIAWILYRWMTAEGPERASRALGRVGLSRAGQELGDALAGLEQMTRPSGRWQAAGAIAATFVATFMTFLQGYFVARSLDLHVTFPRLSAGLAGASIASLLPVSVSGIGIREATLAFYLGPSGIGLSEVLTYSVAFLIIVNGSAALIGALTHALWAGSSALPAAPAKPAALGVGEGQPRA
jgi:uncharacterized protein (TIRG00374 family)